MTRSSQTGWSNLEKLVNDVTKAITKLTRVAGGTNTTLTNNDQKTQIVNNLGYSVGVDPVTHSLLTVDYPHHELHEGNHFFFEENVILGNAASQDYIITTPNTTKWSHFLYKVTGGLGVTINLYENSDRVGTTPQTVNNNNRNSLNTATTTVHKGQSGGTTDGTSLIINGFGTGTVGGSGGESLREDEIILKQNTKYLFRVTNRATNNNTVSIKLSWYEHTSID